MIVFAAFALAASDPALDLDAELIVGEQRARPGPDLPIPADPHAGDPPPDRSVSAFDSKSQLAAGWLHVSVEFVTRARLAVESVYERHYPQARSQFTSLDQDYPQLALGPVGLVLIYQALMFENLDYRYDGPYKLAFAEGRRRLEASTAADDGWAAPEHFLLAGLYGIDGVYVLRLGQHLAAVGRAYDAIRELGQARSMAAEFVDVELGDGMYLYWRSVVAAISPLVPRFSDRRMEGLRLMQKVEKEGILLGPTATIALTYAYMEERHWDAALSSCHYAEASYPDNVINLLTTGRVLNAQRRPQEALAVYDRVAGIAPDNQRIHFLRGTAWIVAGDAARAATEWKTYVAFPEVAPYYRAQTWNRLGLLYERQGDMAAARSAWQAAVDADANSAARHSLTRTAP